MSRARIRIALAQINSTVGDIEGNAAAISLRASEAVQAGADLIVFPELALTGYPPEDLLFRKHFVDVNLDAARRLARSLPAVTVFGFVDRDASGRVYNAAAVSSGGRIAAVYRKMCLPNYGVFDEKRHFSAGERALLLRTDRGSVAVSICEDLWPDGNPYLHAAAAMRPDLVVNLSASPYHFRKIGFRDRLMQKRARQLRAGLCYCNLVGGQDELVFDGSSLVFGPRGGKEAGGAHFAEDLVICDVPTGLPRRFPAGGRSPKRPWTEVKLAFGKGRAAAPASMLRPRPPRALGPEEEVYRALVTGTRDYVRKNRFTKVALGLSGGIDSALVAAVATDALGPENVVAVSMPSMFSSKGTRSDARRIAENLGIAFREVPIEGLRGRYLEAMAQVLKGSEPNEAEENIQARIRGNVLMALSNKFNYLVLTTGNKSELATGYCTLYGDMAGGFAVIKDVPKTMVYRLCRWRNANRAPGAPPPVPESVIRRAPSAELRFRQKDTDTLPPYPVLDRIIEDYVENDLSPEQIVSRGHAPKRTVDWVVRRIDLNEYKRRQGPVGIKITPKAFGRDRRMPITNRFR